MQSLPYGILPTGETVHAWTLGNAAGASMQVITLGGIVTHLRIPDRNGELADVVLGFDSLKPYLAGHPYFGAIVGRVAGRIRGGRFMLRDQMYQLALNDPPNHLHGGIVGFDKRLWTAERVFRADGADSVRLSLESPDGEEGYPGNVDVAVTLTLTDRNEFLFETEVLTDRPTPVNLTHHSYFNLAGEGTGTVEGHELQICADSFAPTDGKMGLLGHRETVIGRSNDFNHPRRLGDAVPHLFQQHGDLYFLSRHASRVSSDVPQLVARVFDPASGRSLAVSTTEDCLQFYTGLALDGPLTGKSGRAYGPHAGLCLECQGYPDGANTPACGNIIVGPGQPLRQTTIYAFSANNQPCPH